MSATLPPKGRLSLFNIFSGVILGVGGLAILYRFVAGLGATTNLSHDNPWGLWIGFDVMSGVALAAGGFTVSSAVYLFGLKEYKAIVRPALLTGFIGYVLVVVGLLVDLGRPWRLPFPFIKQAGPTSALFEVSLCVALYLSVLFFESLPAACEWLGLNRLRQWLMRLTIPLTIFGLLLSTLHQSSLGALFAITPTKLHPLWYSGYLPVHFFISAVAAGISMVIVESRISHRAFAQRVAIDHAQLDRITIGLAKAGAVVLAIYFATKMMAIVADYKWRFLATGWGAWYLVELLGFVAFPCFLYLIGYREGRVGMIRGAAIWTVIGIILNRFNVSFIAFNWQLPAPARYVPSGFEVLVTLTLVVAGVVAFKVIAERLPILNQHPGYAEPETSPAADASTRSP